MIRVLPTPCFSGRRLGLVLDPKSSSAFPWHPQILLYYERIDLDISVILYCLTWSKDHVPVVHASPGVENALSVKPGVEHVLGEDQAPHVTVVASAVANWK